MTNEQFRALEDISGHRSPSNSKAGSSKADDLLAAAISAFAGITRPGRQDMQQLEDLAMPLLHCASTRGKRHAANALAQLEDAPRRLILALADEPVEISAPILLRSPLLRPSDLIEIIGKNGLAHARAIARRQSGDILLQGVLRSFADPVIDRTLTLQENLANIEAEPLERPDVPDLSAARAPLMKEDSSERLARALQQPFFEAGATTGSQHLIDTALLIDSQFFRNALADALVLGHAGVQQPEGLAQRFRCDEVAIVERGVIFWKSAVDGTHQAANRKGDTRGAVLPLVVSIRREFEHSERMPAMPQHMLGREIDRDKYRCR